MSYVRFGWGPNNEYPGTAAAKKAGASNLYMFPTGSDSPSGSAVECCGCIRSENYVLMRTLDEVREHLDVHRKAGDVVHDYVLPAIEADFASGYLHAR